MRGIELLMTTFVINLKLSDVQVIQADAAECDLPPFNVCVANVTSCWESAALVFFNLLSRGRKFRCAFIMFQRKFAMSLLAQPGDSLYCRLSIDAQFVAHVSHLQKVGRNNFYPPLEVDSCLVRIEPRRPRPRVNRKEWRGLLSICFAKKNKKLTLGAIFRQRNVLSLLTQNGSGSVSGSLDDDIPDRDSDISALMDSLSLDTDAADDNGKDYDDEDMEVDGEGGDVGTCALRRKVLDVLVQGKFSSRRPLELAEADLINLLSLFNESGIHFP